MPSKSSVIHLRGKLNIYIIIASRVPSRGWCPIVVVCQKQRKGQSVLKILPSKKEMKRHTEDVRPNSRPEESVENRKATFSHAYDWETLPIFTAYQRDANFIEVRQKSSNTRQKT